MLRVVADGQTSAEMGSGLDELVREGARRMLAAALEAEVGAYVSGLVDEVDDSGKRLVVRNGHHQGRRIVTGAGPVEVVAPRVNDRRVDEATGDGAGSAARSCRRGLARARRWPRCCR
jgi:putative transposase